MPVCGGDPDRRLRLHDCHVQQAREIREHIHRLSREISEVEFKEQQDGGQVDFLSPLWYSSTKFKENRVLFMIRRSCTRQQWKMPKEERTLLFHEIDKLGNGDGTMTRDELEHAMHQPHLQDFIRRQKGFIQSLLNPWMRERGWNLLDIDGSGEVSLLEWNAWMRICSDTMMRFLEAEHHLACAAYWGYGHPDSSHTPYQWWGEWWGQIGPASPQDRTNRHTRRPTIGRMPESVPILPLDALDTHRSLPHFVQADEAVACLPRGWKDDLWYYLCQNHPLLSQFFVDADHPLMKHERQLTEFINIGYTLLMSAAHNLFVAQAVARFLPATCASSTYDCEYHNCLCRPGYTTGCWHLKCPDFNDHGHLADACQAYTGIGLNNTNLWCFETTPWWLEPVVHSTWLYSLLMVTLPSLILDGLTFLMLACPCTLEEVISADYQPSVVKKILKGLQRWAMVFLTTLAVVIWLGAFVIIFREVLGWGESWVEYKFWMLFIFIISRLQSYILAVVLPVIMQFNLFVVDSNGDLWWWCDRKRSYIGFACEMIGLGQWHTERLMYEDMEEKSRTDESMSLLDSLTHRDDFQKGPDQPEYGYGSGGLDTAQLRVAALADALGPAKPHSPRRPHHSPRHLSSWRSKTGVDSSMDRPRSFRSSKGKDGSFKNSKDKDGSGGSFRHSKDGDGDRRGSFTRPKGGGRDGSTPSRSPRVQSSSIRVSEKQTRSPREDSPPVRLPETGARSARRGGAARPAAAAPASLRKMGSLLGMDKAPTRVSAAHGPAPLRKMGSLLGIDKAAGGGGAAAAAVPRGRSPRPPPPARGQSSRAQ